MKKKDHYSQPHSNSTQTRTESEWPKLYREDAERFLADRVSNVARNSSERQLFSSILEAAYDQILELKQLYGDLPGVLQADPAAVSRFRGILAHASHRHSSSPRHTHGARSTPLRDQLNAFGDGPCRSTPFIDPSIIFLLREGIARISSGNPEIYSENIAALGALWQQGSRLDRFYRNSVMGPASDGGDRLANDLRLGARERRSMGPGSDAGGPSMVGPDEARGGRPTPPDVVPGETGLPPDENERPDRHARRGEDPGWPPDECDEIRELCEQLLLQGLAALGPLPESTYVTGIDYISPQTACERGLITIHGNGFGATQPQDVVVVIGILPVAVESWTDSAITFRVPDNVQSGCVGFRNEVIEQERRNLYQQHRQMLEDLAAATHCLGAEIHLPVMPYTASSPQCTGTNHFTAPMPVIESFYVNGETEVTVTPGTNLTLTWQISNARRLLLRRTSLAGPSIEELNPTGNVRDLGAFDGERPVDATYELIANNPCGTVERRVTARLRAQPNVTILGIELVQSIQRFNLADPADNNSVPLVARKRTLARVYVDSGIRNGFNYDGPNNLDVTGQLTLVPVRGGPAVNAGRPLNYQEIVTARPAENIRRQQLFFTLNFDLPIDHLSGDVRFEVIVSATGGADRFGGLGGWHATDDSTIATFHNCRDINLVRLLIRDERKNAGPPTAQDYATDAIEALARFPISDLGFNFYIVPGKEELETDYDYGAVNDDGTANLEGWFDLLDDIEDIVDCVDDQGLNLIWTALLPIESVGDNQIYGMGNEGPPPHSLSVIGGDLFAHELGHTFNVNHAPCGLSMNETPDPRLPAETEDAGVHMHIVPILFVDEAIKEIMSYCREGGVGRPVTKWGSIALWNIIFDQLRLSGRSRTSGVGGPNDGPRRRIP